VHFEVELLDDRYRSIELFKLEIPSDILEASNMGIDFFAVPTFSKCSLERPVVPDIKGIEFSIQKLTHAINPSGEEKSITADISFRSFTSP
jgi:hypothetical protein